MQNTQIKPTRVVHHGDAFAWLDANSSTAGTSIVTSLPDLSEMSSLDLPAWRAWFIATVRRLVRWMPEDGVAIFYQSDIRHQGGWIDKGYLVSRGAEEEGARQVFHKIVCRKPAGTLSLGRPTYAHMIALTRIPHEVARKPGPDVLPDAGEMSWSRAMGIEACRVACAFLRDNTSTRTVVDPFCGRGSVLAIANGMGLNAIGIEIAAKRCRAARSLTIDD